MARSVDQARVYRLFGDGFFLTEGLLAWYKGHYLGELSDAVDPRCSPLLAEELGGIAAAYIATASFDPLTRGRTTRSA